MNDDYLDQFETGPPDDDGEQHSFGELNYPWQTPYQYDGPQAPAPRRPELLGDQEAAWWADVTAWTEWAIATFRLSRWFPPCWLRHPALVEEAHALWLGWCAAWMPGTDPLLPGQFLATLAAAVGRIETLWQVPCRQDAHSEPTPPRASARIPPTTRDWWSIAQFDPTVPAW